MNIDAITWKELPEFADKHVLVYGTDDNALKLVEHIREKHPSITVDAFLLAQSPCQSVMDLPVISLEKAREQGMLKGANVLIANSAPVPASNLFIDDDLAALRIVSTQLHSIFHAPALTRELKAVKTVTPFYIERGTPPVPALVSNAYIAGGPAGDNIFELADFHRQEYVTWTMPSPSCQLSLKKFAAEVPQDALPMRMSHLNYLL